MTKKDLKNATSVDTSRFAKKDDLASLKLEIDELDIGKLESIPVDLSKLSVVVKEVLKRMCMVSCSRKLMLFRLLIPVF